MTDLMKLLPVLVLTAVLAMTVKNRHGELSLLIAMAGGAVALLGLLGPVKSLVGFSKGLVKYTGLGEEVFAPVLKILGISVVSRFSAQLCRDVKEESLAYGCELAGSLAALLCAVPLIARVLQMILTLL